MKHAVIVGILGKYADRFHEYQPNKSFFENLETASKIDGIQGLEVVYPQDFMESEKTIQAIKNTGLPVSALNLNVKSESKWKYGSFTNPDADLRKEAVEYLKNAMDLAAELNTEMVTCCPLIDGHDYNFQVNYLDQWQWLIEGIREGASHRSDIKVSLEYKPFEARNNIILADLGRTLHLIHETGQENIGVTVDVGHALAAQENPAEMLSIAHLANKLYYVHFNDNNRGWDWDMLPGSVNFWDLLETLYYLKKINWDGWITYDVFTRHGDPAESFETTFRIMENGAQLIQQLDDGNKIQDLIGSNRPAKTFDYLFQFLRG